MHGNVSNILSIRLDWETPVKNKRLLVFLLMTAYSVAVLAECVGSNICDDHGQNCRVRDICSDITDLPSLNLPPIQPLPAMEIRPLPALNPPPPGTSSCQYMQINGRWKVVCY